MDYIKIKFGDDIDELDSRFEKTMEDMFRSLNPMFRLTERTWKPQMDIHETPEEVIILAEIAGADKDRLEIQISSKAVRIFGFRDELPRTENTTYRLAEIQYGKFARTLYLPALIDTEKVSASYVDGFLKIQLAKMPPPQVHRIPISDE